MIESEVANEWIERGRAEGLAESRAEGQAEGRVEGVIMVLVTFLKAKDESIPAEVEAKIRGTADLVVLKGWVPLAVTTATLTEFRAAIGLLVAS